MKGIALAGLTLLVCGPGASPESPLEIRLECDRDEAECLDVGFDHPALGELSFGAAKEPDVLLLASEVLVAVILERDLESDDRARYDLLLNTRPAAWKRLAGLITAPGLITMSIEGEVISVTAVINPAALVVGTFRSYRDVEGALSRLGIRPVVTFPESLWSAAAEGRDDEVEALLAANPQLRSEFEIYERSLSRVSPAEVEDGVERLLEANPELRSPFEVHPRGKTGSPHDPDP
jgi:hypothetical protein